MNPYQRPSPRTASPANSLQTNPTRTNNQRHNTPHRSPYIDSPPYNDRGGDDGDDDMVSRGEQMAEPDQRQYQKVNQVIQNFFTKSALSIVSSRVTLAPAYNKNGDLRQNKWFNVILDDSDELQQRLTEWKTMDAMAGHHPTLCIEIYLDISGLGHKQSLVVHDEDGKRWDVAQALNKLELPRQSGRTTRPTQLVLERWRISVEDVDPIHPSDLSEPLPNVYKKAVVLFRGLYANLRLLPAFKYNKSLAKQPANHPSLKLNYRVFNGERESPYIDTLSLPLYESSNRVINSSHIGSTNSPIGPLCVNIEYRENCDFSVADSESLLSSQFMGLDDNYYEQKMRTAAQVPGSLPVNKMNAQQTPDVGQAYGSMSTFHHVGPTTGASPISALRAVRDMPSSSPMESPPQKLPPNHRTAQGSKSSLRSTDTASHQRRTSVSFQPFKAGSLSSSPAPAPVVPSPGSSLGRPSSSLGRNAMPSALTQPRNRTSLNALPQAALRAPSLPNETAIASSASSSPKPAPIARYSSSFGHRRSKFSSGGASRIEDDNLSSGKGSATSSIQRGSETMNEGEGASSGEVKTDDENISDFLKLLESKKDLKSFNRSDNAAREATMRKTTAQLGKYQRMKDSHSALSDSVSSSMMLHRSSSSSSRQLSSVPAMIAGTSVSTASSPGKPISPHTPHTPAIPSRLSANSIIEYEPVRRSRSQTGRAPREQGPANAEEPSEGEDGADGIDIPNSPRPWNYPRRSSSVAQQNRNLPEDEPDLFGVRSASLPAEEGDRARDLHRITSADLTSSGLFAQTELLASASRDNQTSGNNVPVTSRDDLARPSSTSDLPAKRGAYPSGPRGRGFFSHSPSTSLNTIASTGATSSTERQSRYAFNSRATNPDDDEPLLFQMSEIGAGSRRSLEEARGGASTGSTTKRGSPWNR